MDCTNPEKIYVSKVSDVDDSDGITYSDKQSLSSALFVRPLRALDAGNTSLVKKDDIRFLSSLVGEPALLSIASSS